MWTRAMQAPKVLCGGKRHGAIYEATLLENVPWDCNIVQNEAFGPVACLLPLRHLQQGGGHVRPLHSRPDVLLFFMSSASCQLGMMQLCVMCSYLVIQEPPATHIDSMYRAGACSRLMV